MSTPTLEEQVEVLIQHATNRFCGWSLPKDFHPDAGISFKAEFNEHTDHPMKHEPYGTNLFTACQAKEMLRFLFEDEVGNNLLQQALLTAEKRGATKVELKVEAVIDKHYVYKKPSTMQMVTNRLLNKIIKTITK